MGHPELPFLASGGIAIYAATVKNGKLPELTYPLLGTVGLVIVASVASDTKYEPLVRAIGMLLVTTTVIAAVNAVRTKAKARNGG